MKTRIPFALFIEASFSSYAAFVLPKASRIGSKPNMTDCLVRLLAADKAIQCFPPRYPTIFSLTLRLPRIASMPLVRLGAAVSTAGAWVWWIDSSFCPRIARSAVFFFSAVPSFSTRRVIFLRFDSRVSFSRTRPSHRPSSCLHLALSESSCLTSSMSSAKQAAQEASV